MKELIIPTRSENSVSLAEIDEWYDGVILCYKDSKCVGYIIFYNGSWNYMMNINTESDLGKCDDILFDLIEELMDCGLCDSFKVIDF